MGLKKFPHPQGLIITHIYEKMVFLPMTMYTGGQKTFTHPLPPHLDQHPVQAIEGLRQGVGPRCGGTIFVPFLGGEPPKNGTNFLPPALVEGSSLGRNPLRGQVG